MRRSILPVVVGLALAGCGAFKDDAGGPGGTDGGQDAAGNGGDDAGWTQGNDAGGTQGNDAGGTQGNDAGGTQGNDAGNDGSASATTGAGPFGDLPSGYCCTADADCRNRHCATITGGAKMCEDECDGAQSLCNGLLPNFTCTASGEDGFCTPPAGTTSCVPASQYVHGTKATGACCSATGDATAGQECLGGNCGATGDNSNPFICENACSTGKDCPPGNYECQLILEYSLCIPLATHYTCQ